MKRIGVNTVYEMHELLPDKRHAVELRPDGIFRDMFVKDGEIAYGFTGDCRSYMLDSKDVEKCAQYRWFMDNTECRCWTMDIVPGHPVEMGAFLITSRYCEGGHYGCGCQKGGHRDGGCRESGCREGDHRDGGCQENGCWESGHYDCNGGHRGGYLKGGCRKSGCREGGEVAGDEIPRHHA